MHVAITIFLLELQENLVVAESNYNFSNITIVFLSVPLTHIKRLYSMHTQVCSFNIHRCVNLDCQFSALKVEICFTMLQGILLFQHTFFHNVRRAASAFAHKLKKVSYFTRKTVEGKPRTTKKAEKRAVSFFTIFLVFCKI